MLLYIALENRYINVIKLLLKKGANIIVVT
jgi:hypothetical protein